MKLTADVTATVEIEVWAKPDNGEDLDHLAKRLTDMGNDVVYIDRDNNRIKLRLED